MRGEVRGAPVSPASGVWQDRRAGGAGREQESVGIALCKTEAANGEMTVFALITYAMPALSARMAPQLKRFCKEVVEPCNSGTRSADGVDQNTIGRKVIG